MHRRIVLETARATLFSAVTIAVPVAFLWRYPRPLEAISVLEWLAFLGLGAFAALCWVHVGMTLENPHRPRPVRDEELLDLDGPRFQIPPTIHESDVPSRASKG